MSERLFLWMVCLQGLEAAGCAGQAPLGMATNSAEARAAITLALESWKQGVSQQALAAFRQPVFMQDDAFARAKPLAGYSLEGEGKVVGTGISQIVNLSFQGESKPRKVAYRVVTRPHKVVTREEGFP